MISPLSSNAILKETSSSAVLAAAKTPKIEKEISVLLLGLDARRGDRRPRCDAIHILVYNPGENKITITSIPRGTSSNMENAATGSAYLGNVCHIMGIEEAILRIEKISGIHPDYTIKVGFSQSLGILRALKLPTTPTLQFLRDRRFGIGDFQRSHNQAIFIKDMITKHIEEFARMPKVVKYLIFKMVDTDMPFEVANTLLEQIIETKVYEDPDLIILLNKPSTFRYMKELHFSEEEFENPSSWENDEEFKKYQNNLESYLQNLIISCNKFIETKREKYAFKKIETPFSQQLWLQLEDEGTRNQIYFDMLKIYAFASPDKSQVLSLILDFTTEMENYNQKEFKEKGKELLEMIQKE